MLHATLEAAEMETLEQIITKSAGRHDQRFLQQHRNRKKAQKDKPFELVK